MLPSDLSLRAAAEKNHAVGVHGIRNLLRYVISSQSCMESSRRINAQYALRAMPYATSLQFHTTRKRVDYIPSLREPPKLAHSLRGTPTAAWMQPTKKGHQLVSFSLVAGRGFEPPDLRVMSPTSYQAALPRDIKPLRCVPHQRALYYITKKTTCQPFFEKKLKYIFDMH